ncbi:glycoside hydrolase family 3 C-terminal domain-containing protein [Petroclostridium xylanilyticum]|uniref:glycoside hydrolase family 3 C-terminal domain-containing protein n=1 Tax=Petroclostridium xylanilyticum TaxID=1792311 RepID=UPI000B997EB6|nr:glycoside hydrolase family 3 C-terminal domain-containing protein [Petroclostridium xylanilyticum]
MSEKYPFMNPDLSIEERVKDLVSRMTLEEKVSQMLHSAPAIERLGVPAYNWWCECLHGVARAGVATVFPQAIGMAAAFDEELIYDIACVISDEARAKYHEFQRQGDHGIYKGLTYWSPNINIFRDPRWGRGHETYGEDPYLTGRLGVAFVKGLQGDDPKYLKLVATPKHFAVHSGPEGLRHEFNAIVSKKDMYETYLPAFKECVKEAKAESIMGAYNRVNDEPCCGSKTLLQNILRDEWGFDGYVVSDCWAVQDFHLHHHVTSTSVDSAAMAVTNGCDLNCGCTFANLLVAHKEGLISEKTIDEAVKRLFRARFKLGMFDPDKMVPYASIPYEVNDCEEHREFAVDVARKTMVLLKNENNLLPLDKNIKSIAVIGPNADDREVLLANYSGTPSKYVTPLEGIRSKVSKQTRIYYALGCHLTKEKTGTLGTRKDRFAEAISAAQKADIVVMCLGLSAQIEGEQGDVSNSDAAGDKVNLDLPGLQQELLEEIYKTGKPIVLVLLSGSALAINWADEHIPAILQAWYPGAEGGRAIADVLFGDHNPSGRLPVTFVKSMDDLPPFEDYSMKNRTYRYMTKEALYPFGYGLSYTRFKYTNLRIDKEVINIGELVQVSVEVENVGDCVGDEIVQLYLKDMDASVDIPNYQLQGFKRITLEPNEKIKVTFTVSPRQMALINEDGKCILEPGDFRVYVGGSQPDSRSEKLMGQKVNFVDFKVQGNAIELG